MGHGLGQQVSRADRVALRLPGRGQRLQAPPDPGGMWRAAAEVLGISIEELRAEMEAGETTILGVAQARGLDAGQFTADVECSIRIHGAPPPTDRERSAAIASPISPSQSAAHR